MEEIEKEQQEFASIEENDCIALDTAAILMAQAVMRLTPSRIIVL